jgi:hypothetical protein
VSGVSSFSAAARKKGEKSSWEETLERRDWVAAVESYVLALWHNTQAHRSRGYEHALGHLPRGTSFELDGLVWELVFGALSFGARVGALVGHGAQLVVRQRPCFLVYRAPHCVSAAGGVQCRPWPTPGSRRR